MVLQSLPHQVTLDAFAAAVQAVRSVSKRPVILLTRDVSVAKAGLKALTG